MIFVVWMVVGSRAMPQDDIGIGDGLAVGNSETWQSFAEEVLIGLKVLNVGVVEMCIALGLLERRHREVSLRETLFPRQAGLLTVMTWRNCSAVSPPGPFRSTSIRHSTSCMWASVVLVGGK